MHSVSHLNHPAFGTVFPVGLAILLFISTACRPEPRATPSSTATPASTPTPAPTATAIPPRPHVPYTPEPPGNVAPVVIQRTPETGERLSPDGAIELVFDRPMNQASVAAAFTLHPSVKGDMRWTDARTFVFKPFQALPRNAVVDVVLSQVARAIDGASLRESYQFRITTQDNLEVGQTIPAANAQDIDPATLVTVLFNHPVVPLTTLKEQAELPQPLSFNPPIEGLAEWLNTSILVFRPTHPLPGGTSFTGRLNADLKDTSGNPLASDYTWTFSTAAPRVITVSPDPRGSLARVDTAITVQFDQDVEAISALQAFKLLGPGDARINGQATVLSDTLTFTPAQLLSFDATYTILVTSGVLSRSGGSGSRQDWSSTFRSVPLPRVVDTVPEDGTRDAYSSQPFVIRFNTDIDPATVMPHLHLAPEVSLSLVYTYYNAYNHSFILASNLQPATDYVVEISPGIADPYGNLTQEYLRVAFHTRDLPPSVAMQFPGNVATLNAYLPARVAATVVNVKNLSFELSAIDTSDAHFMLQDDRQLSTVSRKLLRQWQQSVQIPPNKMAHLIFDLVPGGGKLPPGAYWLHVTSPDIAQDRFNQHLVLVVSEVNLTMKSEPAGALVWATDMQTGRPVGNLPVKFYVAVYGQQLQMLPAGDATTDGSGVAQVPISPEQSPGYHEVIAVTGRRFAAINSTWSGGVSAYSFDLPVLRSSGYAAPFSNNGTSLRAYIYTDRPIYRPGQQVDLRGVVRWDDDASYTLPPPGTHLHLVVQDSHGKNVLDQMMSTDAYGSFNSTLILAAEAALGRYSIRAAANTNIVGYALFDVSAYRPPEDEVLVMPGVHELARGETLTATVLAHYLSGGGLRNRPVTWNVLATPTTFDPPQLDAYTFSDSDDPWYCFACWHYPGYQVPPQPLLQGSSRTDERGQLDLTIPISTEIRDAQRRPYSGPLSLSIEAVASGADNQPISGRSSVMVHPADFYLGLAIPQYLIRAGRPATVEVVAVDWAGQRLPGKPFEVLVYRREWKSEFDAASGRWTNETNDVPVISLPATSDARGEAVVSFTPSQAGTYKIIAHTQDEAGRRVQSSRFIWATGSEFIPWLHESNDRIHLISNKSSYLPGETADVLIPSPFEGEHYALVTVERGHILQHEVIAITSSSQVYHLPLTDAFVPNVFVSVVLFQGGDRLNTAAGPGTADFKVGYINLIVQPVHRIISVTLTPDQPIAQPGQTIGYTLRATDSNGLPVTGQFSLDLVDKGVLNLMPRENNAIVQAFYNQRGTRVQTASALTISGNRIVAELQPDAQASQHESVALDAGGAVPAAVATQAPAATAAPSRAQSGASSPALQVRENFADTAYWSPDITTDAQGHASLSLKLPDNLTTWVMRAVGVDSQTRVGEGTVSVIATKPLLIRPVTPRFLVVGDVVQLGAVVNNNTRTSQTAVVALSEASGISLTTPVSQEVTIPAQGETVVNWTAVVGQDPSVNLVFSVANDQYSDASRPRLATAPGSGLKVNRYSAPEVVGTAGVLDAAGSRTEVIALPPRLDTTQGVLSVQLDPSLAASMQAGLTYLDDTPGEYPEAVMSRLLPNVLNYQALREFDMHDASLEAKLQQLVGSSLPKLYALQNEDGGWAWWSNLPSNPYISAYIIMGLLRARDAGFRVNAESLRRGMEYLRGTLEDTAALRQYYEFNQQAYKLYVLGEDGMGNSTKVNELYDARDRLSLYARALLALTLGKTNPQDERLKTLFADLNGQAIVSATGTHWEEAYVDWWAMNTDTRSTAIILSALARLDPQNKLAPNVVRWLMMARTGGIWRTTQETTWSLIALTDWVRASGELKADYSFQAMLNDQPLAQGLASTHTLTQTVSVEVPLADLLRSVSNRLNITRTGGAGRLYYSAYLKAYLPVPSVKAADRGIQVLRRYTLASCGSGLKCPDVTHAKVGDVIRVNLTLIAPSDLYYVQLQDPIPAGADIVDTGLATTSQLAEGPSLRHGSEGPYRWWWFWYSHSELHDDRVVLYASQLRKGTYEYSYTFRVTSAGQYNVIPAFANEQYFPEIFGRSDGMLFTVED